MPRQPKRRCCAPGCIELVEPPDYRCSAHKAETQNRSEYHRRNNYFYSSARWRAFRSWFLKRNPVCNCGAPATVVDHILPIEDGGAKLAAANCQPLCASCHGIKTAADVANREGGVERCHPAPLLPPVQLKKNGRKFLARGLRPPANLAKSASEALKGAKNRRLGHLTNLPRGERGATRHG